MADESRTPRVVRAEGFTLLLDTVDGLRVGDELQFRSGPTAKDPREGTASILSFAGNAIVTAYAPYSREPSYPNTLVPAIAAGDLVEPIYQTKWLSEEAPLYTDMNGLVAALRRRDVDMEIANIAAWLRERKLGELAEAVERREHRVGRLWTI